jgi:hypothetical protein
MGPQCSALGRVIEFFRFVELANVVDLLLACFESIRAEAVDGSLREAEPDICRRETQDREEVSISLYAIVDAGGEPSCRQSQGIKLNHDLFG